MDDEPALGIVMGVILLIAAGLAFTLWIAPPPRQHIYYCCEDSDGFACAPCRHGIGRPVSVGL